LRRMFRDHPTIQLIQRVPCLQQRLEVLEVLQLQTVPELLAHQLAQSPHRTSRTHGTKWSCITRTTRVSWSAREPCQALTSCRTSRSKWSCAALSTLWSLWPCRTHLTDRS